MLTQPFSLNAYQHEATSTAVYPGQGTAFGLLYCTLKMNGEAGEFAEHLGKAMRDDELISMEVELVVAGHGDNRQVFKGTPHALTADRYQKLKHELGDVLWYIAAAATEMGLTLEQVALANLDKLASRQARGTLQGSGDNR